MSADRPTEARVYVHATAVVIGEAGVLIRGASGAGKTSLGRALVHDADGRRMFARFVGDDRIGLRVAGGRLLASPHPALVGRVERRGWGIERVEIEPAAVIRLVVDLAIREADREDRLPGTPPKTSLEGLELPALVLAAEDGPAVNSGRVLTFLCGNDGPTVGSGLGARASF